MSYVYFPVELHCHTIHSDGAMTPERLVDRAKRRGYSAIALTDHNVYSACAAAKAAGESVGLTVIGGIEWTTFFGHAVCLSDDSGGVDWRDITKTNIGSLARLAKNNGAIVTVAHPKRMGYPVCTGCHWDFETDDYGGFTAFEVWSQSEDGDSLQNRLSEQFYRKLLNKGFRLSAVYGYDWHIERQGSENYFFNTYIGADGASADELKDGLRRGDTYIASGLSAALYAGGRRLAFGSEIRSGKHVFDLKIGKGLCKGGVIPETLEISGSALRETVAAAVGNGVCLDLSPGWLMFKVYGLSEGRTKPLLVTSPIYVTD
ncbi:MAG: CehA/McbA family metallohydrolase [Clostridiales bacterium]|nr:CehA/McbA family metallohydrolase [Clostridiales bacterium]